MDCNKNGNGIAKVLLMNRIFGILCAFVVIISGLSLAIASEKPEIFVQRGHPSGIKSVALSPDGIYALSGSADKTIKLWVVATGRELRTFQDTGRVESVAFSPDGKSVVSASGSGFKFWDVSTGREVKTFVTSRNYEGERGYTAYLPFHFVLSSDGRYILSAGRYVDMDRGGYQRGGDQIEKLVRLWDAKTGRLIRTFEGHRKWVSSVALSPDGKYALSVSEDKTLKLWDVSTGREVRTFFGHTHLVNSVAFSPDGKYALSGSYDTTVKLWDIETGREVRTFFGHTHPVNSVAFSPDGKYAVSGSSDETVKLWDIETGIRIGNFVGGAASVVFSRDGKHILSGGSTLKLYDVAARREIKTFQGADSVTYAAFSSDKQYILSGPGYAMQLWDFSNGVQIKSIKLDVKDKKNDFRFLAVSADNKYILASEGDKNLMLWDAITGKKVRKFSGHIGRVSYGAFSPDGRYIVSGDINGTIKLWDSATGTEIRTFLGHQTIIDKIAFLSDGRHIVSATPAGVEGVEPSIRLWDTSTGRQIWAFRQVAMFSLIISPDEKYLMAVGIGSDLTAKIRFLDVKTGREIRAFDYRGAGALEAFSPDGRYFLLKKGSAFISSGTEDNLDIRDTATGREIKTFRGHKSSILDASFSSDGKHLVSGGDDGTTRLWEISTGKEIAQFVSFTDGEWIVITPEGYYNSSLNGHKYLNIRRDNNVYGIEQFYDVFYRPDIVTAKLRGEDISSLITLTIDEAIKNPPPSVEFTALPKDANQPKVKVCYQTKSTGGGIGEVRLFHNGKLIHSDGFYKDIAMTGSTKQLAALSGKAIYNEMRGIRITAKGEPSPISSKSKGETYEDCKEIDAVPGENELSITAFNSQNTVQSYMKTMSFNAKIQPEDPHLYMLFIGIDRYKDSKVNLKYAVKDATDMKEKIFKQSATLFRPENIHLELIADRDAVKGNIINRINAISNKIKPADSFILFVAGHGVLLQNQYYMLTHDFEGTINEGSLISSNEIVEMSKKIKSLSQLFIFDTCHAGGVDYIVSGLYDARMSVLAKKMGLHIYASASSVQEALDGYKGNGLFTYSLLDGLNNNRNADKNNDSKVSLIELGGYSKAKTAEISKSIGHVQTPLIINFGKDNPLYRLR
ncbi:MAG: caspase family protein [Nitrospirae bacterium]|nr:caspase family protein [Nitrospirota bacterium]